MKQESNLSYVLDSYAILSYLEAEEDSHKVKEILERAVSGDCEIFMSVINLGEVAYIVERERGFMNSQKVLAYIDELPISFVDADRYAVLKASHLKAQYSISYADCFAASLSQTKNAVLITGDPEFKKVENLISILWLVNNK